MRRNPHGRSLCSHIEEQVEISSAMGAHKSQTWRDLRQYSQHSSPLEENHVLHTHPFSYPFAIRLNTRRIKCRLLCPIMAHFAATVSFLPFFATSMAEKPPGLIAMEFLSGLSSRGVTNPEVSRLGRTERSGQMPPAHSKKEEGE